MSYRDSHVNFEECLRRGDAQALADRTSSLAPVNELGGALAEMARAVRLTRLSWRWWRDASDDAYGLEGNQYGPFPPGTDCKITFGRDGDIGTIRYVGPNSWSCAGDDFGSAREALARMLTLPDTASSVRMYQIGVAGMTCTWGPRWRPHRVAWYEFGVSHPECCEVPATWDAGLAWGPDRHRRGMTGARTKLALAPSRSQ